MELNGTTDRTLFRLDASIRVEGSHSREIADIVEQEWRNAHPTQPILRRHVGVDPIPATSWGIAVFAGRTQPESRSTEQNDALTLAATLTDELVTADALLFAVPLYNFGVSQHFKTWVDMVITDQRMAAGAKPVLAGKPAILVTVRGGSYAAGTPREGWDHATGWMRRILEDVWRLDLNVVESEFTLVGVNPALDEFKDLARQLRSEAEEQAHRHGRALGAALSSTGTPPTSGRLELAGSE
jgi:FMN-dependent NADH-azoreductase